MISDVVFEIFLVSILIFNSHCTVYMVLQFKKKNEFFTHNTLDFKHNIKVCWIKYLKNKFLLFNLFIVLIISY